MGEKIDTLRKQAGDAYVFWRSLIADPTPHEAFIAGCLAGHASAHLTQPAQAVDVDEPQVFQDLRYWMKHCVSACDEGEDFGLTRDDLIALTTLGLMEKAGRGKWRPTDKGRALAALPNANGKEG